MDTSSTSSSSSSLQTHTDEAYVPFLLKKSLDPKSQRRRLANEVTSLAKGIPCPPGQFGCQPSFKDLVLEDMEQLELHIHMQQLEDQHKAHKPNPAGSEAATSMPSLPSHDFSDCLADKEKVVAKSHQKAFEALEPYHGLAISKTDKIAKQFKLGAEHDHDHSHVEGNCHYRDLMVDGSVAIGTITAAGALTGGVVPMVVGPVHYAGKFADQALPAVDAFLENNPLENVTDAVACMGDVENCPPYYFGLAVKSTLEGVQAASHAIDSTLEALAQPVKKGLDEVGVTDESVVQTFNALGKAVKNVGVIDKSVGRAFDTLGKAAK